MPKESGKCQGGDIDGRGTPQIIGQVVAPHFNLDKIGDSPVSTVLPVINARGKRQGRTTGPTILMPIRINGKDVDAVVDTGSQVTVISQKFHLKHKFPDPPKSVLVRNAEEGKEMTAGAGLTSEITVGETTVPWEALIAPINDDVLVGLDLLAAIDAQIKARGGVIMVNDKVIPTKFVTKNGEQITTARVTLEKSIELQPHTRNVVLCNLDSSYPLCTALLESNSVRKGVEVASVMVQMNPKIPLCVLNLSDRTLHGNSYGNPSPRGNL